MTLVDRLSWVFRSISAMNIIHGIESYGSYDTSNLCSLGDCGINSSINVLKKKAKIADAQSSASIYVFDTFDIIHAIAFQLSRPPVTDIICFKSSWSSSWVFSS